MEPKNTVTTTTKSLEGFKGRFKQAIERISKFKDRIIEIIESEEKKLKKLKKKEQNLRHL